MLHGTGRRGEFWPPQSIHFKVACLRNVLDSKLLLVSACTLGTCPLKRQCSRMKCFQMSMSCYVQSVEVLSLLTRGLRSSWLFSGDKCPSCSKMYSSVWERAIRRFSHSSVDSITTNRSSWWTPMSSDTEQPEQILVKMVMVYDTNPVLEHQLSQMTLRVATGR